MDKAESFQPIIDQRARVLILGSMPGVQSLNEQRYYANPRNHFWRIMQAILSMPGGLDYEDRIEFLQQTGVALWDVIASCERRGSLDTHIKNETVNDFDNLFLAYPAIRLVAFNGTKAFTVYKKRVEFGGMDDITYKLMPSTSAANTIPFEHKCQQWRVILDFL